MKTFIHYFLTFCFIAIVFAANANDIFNKKHFLKIDTVDAPVVNHSPDDLYNLCQGDIVTLTASEAPDGYGYQWYKGYPGYYQPIAGATEQTLLVSQAYFEEFVVQYTGACPSDFSNPTYINIESPPTPYVYEAGDGSLQVGNAGDLDINSYTWFVDGELLQGYENCSYGELWCIQPDQAGDYSVCVYYAWIGCSNCSTSFTYELPDSIAAPVVTSSHGADVIACEGDTITLTASEAPDGYGYQWYEGEFPDDYQLITGATEQILQVTEGYGQDFFVQYTGAQPSDFSNPISVFIQEVPDVVIAETTDGNLEVQGPAAYYYYNDPFTWYLDGEIIELEPCPGIGSGEEWCVQPTQSGTYIVCVDFLKIDCSACSESFNYIYTNTENILGVDVIQISPIPTNDILNISLTVNKQLDLNLKLQNVHGQTLIESAPNIGGYWNTSLNISHLPSGTYFLTLQSHNEIMTTKVLKY